MLSNSREHGHPYLVSHLRGNDFSFSPLRIMFAVGLFYVAFNILCWAFLEAQLVKNPPAIWVTWVQSLGWEDSMEKEKATHSSTLARRIPWTV